MFQSVPMYQRGFVSMIAKMLRKALSDGMYHSFGDDPKRVPKGAEAERPVFTAPLIAFDKVIVSEPGFEPDPTQDLTGLGIDRTDGLKQFIKKIDEMPLEPRKVY